MIQIAVKGGYVALVDDEDADLAVLNWRAHNARGMIYARTCLNNRQPLMHRLIMLRAGFDMTGLQTDHINGDTFDNRRCNLRAVTPTENARNQKLAKSNTSGFAGVSLHRGRWAAYIKNAYRVKWLGSFDTAEEANAARLAAEREQWGIQPRRAGAHA